jgi:hypothetical protein
LILQLLRLVISVAWNFIHSGIIEILLKVLFYFNFLLFFFNELQVLEFWFSA